MVGNYCRNKLTVVKQSYTDTLPPLLIANLLGPKTGYTFSLNLAKFTSSKLVYPFVVLGTYAYQITLAKTLRKTHDNYINLQAKPVTQIKRAPSNYSTTTFHGVKGPPGGVLTCVATR